MPPKPINMIGKVYGRFIVVRKGEYIGNKRHWILECQNCGHKKSRPGTDIRRAFKGEVCEGCIEKRYDCADGYKACSACKKIKPYSEFNTIPHHTDGLSCQCKACLKRAKRVIYRMISSTRKRAKKTGMVCEIDIAFIRQLNESQNGKCVYTGLDLNWEYEEDRDGSIPFDRASIDRIDSTKGYTKDNVQLVVCTANIMKNRFAEEEFLLVCQLIARHAEETGRIKPLKDRRFLLGTAQNLPNSPFSPVY